MIKPYQFFQELDISNSDLENFDCSIIRINQIIFGNQKIFNTFTFTISISSFQIINKIKNWISVFRQRR